MNISVNSTWQLQAIEAIRTNWIPHRKQLRAETEIYTTLVTSSPGDVIVIVGPSRVGKSSLTEMIAARVVDPSSQHSSPFKQVVRISARNGGKDGKFTTQSFLLSALKHMGHPMLATTGQPHADLTVTRLLDRVKISTLQAAFEDSIGYLKVKYLIIDEVQHLSHVAGGLANVLPILDSWKSLAEELGIVLVLTGAYPILQVILQSPHMVGRKSEIHFPRYQQTNADDVAEFSRILVTLDHLIGEGSRSSLINSNDLLYQGSLGCIGLLNKWVVNALIASSIENSESLSEEHLNSTRMSNSDIDSMLCEIELGEELMRNDKSISGTSMLAIRADQHTKKRSKGKPFESKLKRFAVASEEV
ncbi:MAG: TniB family NTP-binding protein [Solimonas sp.]